MADDREYGPQLGRPRKDKYLRHGTKVRLRGQLLGDAEMKDAQWRLKKACQKLEKKRSIEAKRATRAAAQATTPGLYALVPPYGMVCESDMLGSGKAIVLTTGTAHPCCNLQLFCHEVFGAAGLVVPVHVTGGLCSAPAWVEESSTHGPGPISKPVLRTVRAISPNGGAALVAMGREMSFLMAKIVQDQRVAENAGVVVLVQPELRFMRRGGLEALSQLSMVLVISKSVARSKDTRHRLSSAFPHASLRICNDGPPPDGIDLSEVGMCICDLILIGMGCEPSSSRPRLEDQPLSDDPADFKDAIGSMQDDGRTTDVAHQHCEHVPELQEHTQDSDEEEIERIGMFEIVLRPSGGGGRGDTSTKMSVMMLAPEDVWDVDSEDSHLSEGDEAAVQDGDGLRANGERSEGGEEEVEGQESCSLQENKKCAGVQMEAQSHRLPGAEVQQVPGVVEEEREEEDGKAARRVTAKEIESQVGEIVGGERVSPRRNPDSPQVAAKASAKMTPTATLTRTLALAFSIRTHLMHAGKETAALSKAQVQSIARARERMRGERIGR